MSTIITRAGKGSPLTNNEVDANFNNLNSTKLETSAVGTLSTQNANAVAITGGAIDGTTVGSTKAEAGSFTTLNSSGNTRLGGLSGNQSLQVINTFNGVNYAQIAGGTAGGSPLYSAQGIDPNINLLFTTKGAGEYFFNTGNGLQFSINSVANAVNYLQASGAPTNGAVGLNAQGIDPNVNMGYFTKGSGFHFFYTNGNAQAAIAPTASAVNYLQLTGAGTNAAPTISAQGSDANINLKLTTKGTGVVQFGTHTASALTPTGFITITDAGGTSRRLLVG